MKAGERMAVNMPIQGLCADIVKMAMLAAAKLVATYAADAYQILQVHDELIFEVKKDRAQEFSTELKKVMEEVYALSVPVTVEVSVGDNWGEI
jgi:DNA polymerase-1